VGSQGQAVSRSDECFGPSFIREMVFVWVSDRVVACAIACCIGGRSGAVGLGDDNGVADVSACGVWVGKRQID